MYREQSLRKDCVLKQNQLLDLRFFVHHMLAYDWVVFFHFHFTGGVLFIFIGRVKVTGTGAGYEADFVTHG